MTKHGTRAGEALKIDAVHARDIFCPARVALAKRKPGPGVHDQSGWQQLSGGGVSLLGRLLR